MMVIHNRLMHKIYDIMTIGKKIKTNKTYNFNKNDSDVLYYVTVDELFEIIHMAHLAVAKNSMHRAP